MYLCPTTRLLASWTPALAWAAFGIARGRPPWPIVQQLFVAAAVTVTLAAEVRTSCAEVAVQNHRALIKAAKLAPAGVTV